MLGCDTGTGKSHHNSKFCITSISCIYILDCKLFINILTINWFIFEMLKVQNCVYPKHLLIIITHINCVYGWALGELKCSWVNSDNIWGDHLCLCIGIVRVQSITVLSTLEIRPIYKMSCFKLLKYQAFCSFRMRLFLLNIAYSMKPKSNSTRGE